MVVIRCFDTKLNFFFFFFSDLQIGFQNSSYTFLEPQFETGIFGVVFLEKQSGILTEQTYVIVIEVNDATPNTNIRAATLSDDAGDNDYVITLPTERSFVLLFPPENQLLEFAFTLFPDEIAEGTEGFQASSQPSEDPNNPAFTAPTPGVLFPSTFIIIADDDRKRIYTQLKLLYILLAFTSFAFTSYAI